MEWIEQIELRRGGPLVPQLVEAIRWRIAAGELAPGLRMPTVDALSKKLEVSRLTILRTYRLLEQAGLIETNFGGGTVVTGRLDRDRAVQFLNKLPQQGLIPNFESVSNYASVCSLATALPDPKLLSMDEFGYALQRIPRMNPWALYLPPAQGFPELQRAAVPFLEPLIPGVESSHVCVTAGSTAGLLLAIDEAADDRRRIGYLSPAGMLVPSGGGLHNTMVPLPEALLTSTTLESELAKADISALIVSSTAHMIHGRSYGVDRMERLLAACQVNQIQVIDHLPNGRYQGEDSSPCVTAASLSSNVLTNVGLDSHFCAGLGLGFVVAPPAFRKGLSQRQFLASMGVSALIQQVGIGLLQDGAIERMLRRLTRITRDRRLSLLGACSIHLEPLGCTWQIPDSGLSMCIYLPSGASSSALFEASLARGVAILPGVQIACEEPERMIRLSASMQAADAIREGVRVIAECLRAQLSPLPKSAP